MKEPVIPGTSMSGLPETVTEAARLRWAAGKRIQWPPMSASSGAEMWLPQFLKLVSSGNFNTIPNNITKVLCSKQLHNFLEHYLPIRARLKWLKGGYRSYQNIHFMNVVNVPVVIRTKSKYGFVRLKCKVRGKSSNASWAPAMGKAPGERRYIYNTSQRITV